MGKLSIEIPSTTFQKQILSNVDKRSFLLDIFPQNYTLSGVLFLGLNVRWCTKIDK